MFLHCVKLTLGAYRVVGVPRTLTMTRENTILPLPSLKEKKKR